tara:strand:- start:179 stop:355 length:177 start_codon:yes stop_codon:yes gene_type:complete
LVPHKEAIALFETPFLPDVQIATHHQNKHFQVQLSAISQVLSSILSSFAWLSAATLLG